MSNFVKALHLKSGKERVITTKLYNTLKKKYKFIAYTNEKGVEVASPNSQGQRPVRSVAAAPAVNKTAAQKVMESEEPEEIDGMAKVEVPTRKKPGPKSKSVENEA